MKIQQLTIRQLSLPLTIPYKLSLDVVKAFSTVLVEMRDSDGRTGLGEATLLRGYTEETMEEAWREICTTGQALVGLDAASARERILPMHGRAPFSCTALMTAVEMLEEAPVLRPPEGAAVPLLAILSAEAGEALEQEIEAHVAAGYATLKIKVGFDLDSDLARVARIQEIAAGRLHLRIDANQGYSRAEGCRFVQEVDPANVELVEQTCAAGDWDAAVAVSRAANVPVMLDESIYGIADVERAAELGCATHIKFKLMKAGGLQALADALQRIRDLGMEPILGNGVAGDIGCWMEACVAHRQLSSAGEMNGFLKPVDSLLEAPMTVRGGQLLLPTAPPALSPAKLEAATMVKEVFE